MDGQSQIFRKMAVSPAFSSYSFGGPIYDDVYSFRTLGEPAYHGRSPWPRGAVQLMLEHDQKQESGVLDHLSVYFSNVQRVPTVPLRGPISLWFENIEDSSLSKSSVDQGTRTGDRRYCVCV